ncbi:efflux RND transporter periplasmic adaptor subunit [Paraferrimonas sedimenticola]|uniref:RND transporter MFP subunit n=1 Tax=Paraferrimonas sedimenticola TaxID=375674 RepID=A0AA37W034_9GAMM|nr:efflux RND transporter periplasmic adaptor subunit [Paraferrimonas sedimenticola]GLP94873.1 RND transporter MFP subunit [Paraferrimonas sedimenticola]
MKSLATLSSLALACALLVGCNAEQQTAEEKKEDEFLIPVEISEVSLGDISSYYSTTATLEAPQESMVVSRLAGIVESLHVEEGDRVQAGQLLATVDAKRQKFDLDRAQAEVEIIEQELNRLRKIKNQQFLSRDSMAKLEYNLQAAIANRDLAALKVEESQIRSPIDGVVAKRMVKLGNMATEYQQLFHVVNESELHGIVYLPEQQLNYLRLGQHAKIEPTASKDKSFDSTVLRISPVVDANSGTFKVTLAVPNQSHELKAGMFARVQLKYDTHEQVITVPVNSLVNQDNGKAIFVLGEDGKQVERRQVQTGYRENNRIEIVDGLSLDDQIIVRGQHNLKDAAKVEVIAPLDIATAQK